MIGIIRIRWVGCLGFWRDDEILCSLDTQRKKYKRNPSHTPEKESELKDTALPSGNPYLSSGHHHHHVPPFLGTYSASCLIESSQLQGNPTEPPVRGFGSEQLRVQAMEFRNGKITKE